MNAGVVHARLGPFAPSRGSGVGSGRSWGSTAPGGLRGSGRHVSDRDRSARRRSLGVVVSTVAFGGYLMLSAVPAQAAAGNCTYDAVNKLVTFVMADGGSDGSIGVGAGGAIVADDEANLFGGAAPSQCGVATVNNTDGIVIDSSSQVTAPNDLVIDLSGGPLGPGETPEVTGTPEIEIDVPGVFNDEETLEVVGSDGNDTITAGDGGSGATTTNGAGAANLNGDNDADLTFNYGDGVLSFTVTALEGDDTVSLNGGGGTAGPLEQEGSFANGREGNDILTGTSFDADGTTADTSRGDELEGGEGNDTLNGLGGDDQIEDEGILTGTATCAQDELDVLNGGDDEDDLFAGTGRDLLDGGNGADEEEGDNCNDLFDQGSGPNGNDTLN